jgi:hypothetical protein
VLHASRLARDAPTYRREALPTVGGILGAVPQTSEDVPDGLSRRSTDAAKSPASASNLRARSAACSAEREVSLAVTQAPLGGRHIEQPDHHLAAPLSALFRGQRLADGAEHERIGIPDRGVRVWPHSHQ